MIFKSPGLRQLKQPVQKNVEIPLQIFRHGKVHHLGPNFIVGQTGVGVFKRLFSNGHSGAPLPETYTWDRTGWYAVFGVWRLESVNLFSKVGFLGH